MKCVRVAGGWYFNFRHPSWWTSTDPPRKGSPQCPHPFRSQLSCLIKPGRGLGITHIRSPSTSAAGSRAHERLFIVPSRRHTSHEPCNPPPHGKSRPLGFRSAEPVYCACPTRLLPTPAAFHDVTSPLAGRPVLSSHQKLAPPLSIGTARSGSGPE